MNKIIVVILSVLLTMGCTQNKLPINHDISFDNFEASEINLVNNSTLFIGKKAFKRENIIGGDKIKFSGSTKPEDDKINVLMIDIRDSKDLYNVNKKDFELILGIENKADDIYFSYLFIRNEIEYQGGYTIDVDEDAYDKNTDVVLVNQRAVLDAIASIIVDIDQKLTEDLYKP
ncbi:hypothetical protein ACFSCX_19020 [Bacillus salitolerans]|uniref:Lipoprotein n=1 Tax=Bacillus salitolerans TaxID=1437434 RepID=A0ABW4LU75_9BACI